MADYYVNSAATGTNTGASWTNAFVSFWSLPALVSADNVYVASTHVDGGGGGGSKTLTLPASGECAYIISTLAGTLTAQAGARIITTATLGNLVFDGSMYVNGLVFEPLSATTFTFVADSNESGVLSQCTFKNAPAGVVILTGVSTVNCIIDLARDAAGASRAIMQVSTAGTNTQHIALSVINAANRTGTAACIISSPTTTGAGAVQFIGCDFSTSLSACEVFDGGVIGISVEMHNCRLPPTYVLLRSSLTAKARLALYNTGNANEVANSTDNIDVFSGDVFTVFDQTNVPPDCAQSDNGLGGVVKYYWRMDSNSAVVNRGAPLVSDWIYAYKEPGTYTITINCVAAIVLMPKNIYIEVDYLGSATNQKYSVFITPNAGTGQTSYPTGPNWGATPGQNISAPSLVVAQAGLIRARVFFTEPTFNSVNINPKLIIT